MRSFLKFRVEKPELQAKEDKRCTGPLHPIRSLHPLGGEVPAGRTDELGNSARRKARPPWTLTPAAGKFNRFASQAATILQSSGGDQGEGKL